ncbi:MAG: hypothetical protein BroJett003_05940 [Planctomycetota bacterium]|nr:MAG: hypothetical protein BroJett003_05940 [Planctomycetota bacterium]
MARTWLFARLQRALKLACAADSCGSPPVAEIVGLSREARLSRRRFLQATGGVAALAAASRAPAWAQPLLPRQGGKPRIAIVGAGVAGLNAANRLRRSGFDATLYEAAERIGGRMFTAQNVIGEGLATELGGEFIDSIHKDMLALVDQFGLSLIDDQAESEKGLIGDGFRFNGRFFSEEEVVEAFRPAARRIKRDLREAGYISFRDSSPAGRRLDRTSIREYLEEIDVDGFLRELLDVAYLTEYGLETDEQSSLNLIYLIGTDTSGGFDVFGASDERYRVLGGNQQIVERLADAVADQIRLGHRLVAIREHGRTPRLSFETKGGPVEVEADYVLLTLPFTLLREVEIRAELPAWKRRAINELGYGTNAKLLIGFRRRIWRDLGYQGGLFSDENYQSTWDNSAGQPPVEGGLTVYTGGRRGIEIGEGTVEEQVESVMPAIDEAFPGASAARNGRAARMHWPTHPFTKASYACWKVGQVSTIAGAEIEPVGRLYFAGEHCSYNFQGYMNGAAETGRKAARAILQRVRG